MKCPACGKENSQDTRFCGYCGRELKVQPAKPPYEVTKTYQTPQGRYSRGTVIADRYEVIEFLGEGGMGAVYRVYDKKLKEAVALKFLRPEISMEPRLIERFQAELKLARQIAHRHVCRLYDLGEEGLSLFITMEYIQGEDLKRFIRRAGHLNEHKARIIARQVAEGLAEAHHFGIIHRDLKPHNIMIDQEGNAKIMDFGLARSVRQPGITQKGMILGTPEYMPPEQTEGIEADRRSDIYSLGVIMFEMVTGCVPFQGDTPLSVAVKHKLEAPPDPREINPGLSEEMCRIILRCLEKNPEARYQTAEELIVDLKALAEDQSSGTRQTSFSRKTPTATARSTPPPETGKRLFEPGPDSREERIKIQPAARKSRARKFFSALLLLIIILAAGSLIKVALNNTLFKFLSGSKKTASQLGSPGGDGREPRRIEINKQPEAGRRSSGPGVTTELPPFVTAALRESYKYLQSKDAENFQKKLNELRAAIPPDSPYAQALNEIENKVQESRSLEKAGKLEESKGSLAHGETRMRRLLDQVQEKEQADEARKRMEVSRSRAQLKLKGGKVNLLYWVASEKERDALTSYNKNDFSSAETLYNILSRVYESSPDAGGEEAGLQKLSSMALSSRKAAETIKEKAKPDEAWLFNWGNDYLNQADGEARRHAYPVAAELYIAATFLFEKARLTWSPPE